MATNRQVKQRRSTPRSRTGCCTCRIRRVKCDEKRPVCWRCVSTGRDCDGYPATSESQDVVKDNDTCTAQSQTSISSYALPFRFAGGQEDRQMLHYWVVEAAPALSGNLGMEFWNRVVIQQCQHNYVIRNAVLALGALHQEYIFGEHSIQGSDGASKETLVKYNRAIRSLRLYLANAESDGKKVSTTPKTLGPTLTALICCALFYCFEGSQGHSQAAMQHLRNGVSILKRSWDGELTQHPILGCELFHVFSRFDLQASFYNDRRAPLLDLDADSVGLLTEDVNQSTRDFSTVEEAHKVLTVLQNRVMRFLVSNAERRFDLAGQVTPEILAEKSELLNSFFVWRQRLGVLLMAEGSGLDRLEPGSPSAGLATMLAHAQVLGFVVDSNFPYNPLAFGGGTSPACRVRTKEVHECLDLTTALLMRFPAPQGRPCMSAETGSITPLFILAMKTSDSNIASRALDALRAAANRREALYSGDMAQSIIQRLKTLQVHGEETGRRRLDLDSLDIVPVEFRGTQFQNRSFAGLEAACRSDESSTV